MKEKRTYDFTRIHRKCIEVCYSGELPIWVTDNGYKFVSDPHINKTYGGWVGFVLNGARVYQLPTEFKNVEIHKLIQFAAFVGVQIDEFVTLSRLVEPEPIEYRTKRGVLIKDSRFKGGGVEVFDANAKYKLHYSDFDYAYVTIEAFQLANADMAESYKAMIDAAISEMDELNQLLKR